MVKGKACWKIKFLSYTRGVCYTMKLKDQDSVTNEF